MRKTFVSKRHSKLIDLLCELPRSKEGNFDFQYTDTGELLRTKEDIQIYAVIRLFDAIKILTEKTVMEDTGKEIIDKVQSLFSDCD